jgi:hypothetical protein
MLCCFFILTTSFLLCINNFAHKEWVHQHVVQEAYLLLENSISLNGSFVSLFRDQNGNLYPQQEPSHPSICPIIEAAWEEDYSDIVYEYCWSLPFSECSYASVTHFYDPDISNRYANNNFAGGNWENAFEKAEIMWDGNQNFVMQGPFSFADGSTEQIALESEGFSHTQVYSGLVITYDGLPSLINDRTYYIKGVFTLTQYVDFSQPKTIQFSDGAYDIIFAANIIGRIAHLLTDMSVPAHVKIKDHPCDLFDGARIEMEAGGKAWSSGYAACNTKPLSFPAQMTTYSDAFDQGGCLTPWHESDPLFYLFHTTAQIGDVYDCMIYPSLAESGDKTYSTNHGYTEMEDIIDGVPGSFSSWTDQYNSWQETAFVYTIRSVAGLFYWFARETDMVLESEGILTKDALWEKITLTGNVYVPTGKTVTIPSDGEVNLNGYYVKTTGGTIIDEGAVIGGEDARVEHNNIIKGIYPSISYAINSSLSGSTIRFAPKTFDLNLLITRYNRKFKGSNVGQTIFNGNVTITNSNYTTFSNVKMHDYHNITVNGGIGTDVYDIDYMNSSTAVSFYNGNNNDLGGINVNSSSTSSACYFYNTSSYVREISIEGFDFGVWATSNSDLSVSYNSYFCNNLLDLYALSGGQIYVTSSTLSAPWPQSVSGNVTGGTTYECSSSQLSKKIISEEIANEYIPSDELIKLNKDYLLLLTSISDENEEKTTSVLIGYKPEFDALIKDY